MINEIYQNSKSKDLEKEDSINFVDENEKGFQSNLMVHQDQLQKVLKTKLSLTKNQVFRIDRTIFNLAKNAFRRKNEILYCISTQEMSIDIKDVSGKVYLPLITKKELNEKLSKLKPELKKKISMVHLGAIKILIKAQFKDGIDSPIKMALIDNRINSRKDCILGAAKGNLAYGKFMFTVYPKFGLSLESANLDQALSFIHEFQRSDLMNSGDKVFSITYLIGYALTNSHHSIDYKNNPNIELDDVFQEIGTVEENQFCDLSQTDNQWAINIAKNKPFLETRRSSFKTSGNRLQIGSASNSSKEIDLQTISKRIDALGQQLEKVYDV